MLCKPNIPNKESPIYETKQNRKDKEIQFVRSKHSNILSKRPNVDKFKYQCRPKTQKYR